ncbi:MAG: Lrp/AsnC family transcriptional regulator [Akkermansia sp.]|nr:Lrp/AsnC family transcriptional regulator [Akkermansia sp.]
MTQDALLKLLETDARLSDEQIATRLGMKPTEVASRRAALEAEGRIVGYQAIVNDDAEGVSAFIEVRCTPERGGGFNRLAARIARFPEVRNCYLISGGYDLLVMVEAPTLPEVARFVSEKLSSMEGVLSTATHFRLKTYKNNGLLFEEEKTHERLVVVP